MLHTQEELDFTKNIKELAKKSYQERKAMERQLAAQAAQHLGTISTFLKEGDVHQRRSMVEILGHMAPSPKVTTLLSETLLTDTDVKTRRRAAAALGNTGDKALQPQLLKAYELEEHRFVKASIILALGSLGFDWTPEWEAQAEGQGPVQEALRKAMVRGKPATAEERLQHSKRVDRPPALYMLECYPGAEKFVKTELEMHGIGPIRIPGRGWLQVDLTAASDKKLKALGELRTVLATYVLAATEAIDSLSSPDDFLVDTFGPIKSNQKQPEEGLEFRVELPRMSSRSQYRKAVTKAARRIAAECGLRNNPSNYSLDIRLVHIKEMAFALWRDARWESQRLGKPRLVLPASIHPTIAASLCLAGGIDEKDVFCDPCCGAGTILVERLSYGPVERTFGFDISSEAIKLSEQNLSRAAGRVELRVADMRDLPLSDASVSLIVVNLPFGIRVGKRTNNLELYRRFLKEAQRILKSEGRLVAYTNNIAAFEQACCDAQWGAVKRLATVHAGGLEVAIYKGVKP